MTAPASGRRIAPDGWNIVGERPRVMKIRNVNAPETTLFPGAPNDIPPYHPPDIVNAHASPRPIRRAIPMQIQGKPKPRDFLGTRLVPNIEDMRIAERTLAELIGGDNVIGRPAIVRNNDAHAMRLAWQRRKVRSTIGPV